jgi:hypothetical protein
MTKNFSASELARLAAVTPRAVYQWIEACPAELKARLGDLQIAGRFDLKDAQVILKAGRREELANLLGELSLAQGFIPPEPEPEFFGEVVFVAPPKRGRPGHRRISAWVALEDLAGAMENRDRVTAALYRANAEMETIHDATYVAMETIPSDILAPMIARLESAGDQLEEFHRNHADETGELWIPGKRIAAALGWSNRLVATRGWRTPWASRPHRDERGVDEGLEYELSSLPEELRVPILRYLMSIAA